MRSPDVTAKSHRHRRVARRAWLAGTASGLALPFLPRRASAAEVTWRLGHSAPVDFPLHARLVEAAGLIGARSAGQMQVEIYPSSELGSPMGMMGQLRNGTIQAVPLTGQLLMSNLPLMGLPTVGFAFGGYEQLWTALDGGLGTFLRGQLKDRLGIVAMARCWNFGFRQITTGTKPVGTASDLDGMRIRTPPEADFIGLLQALKALPVAMPLASMESALRSQAIDGQESVLQLVKAAGLYRSQTYCSLTDHVWDGQWICIGGKAWANLPKSLQEIVAAAFDEAAVRQRQDSMSAEDQTRKDLERQGMKFNTVDQDGFRQVLRKSDYYAAWRKKAGEDGWAALEKVTGRLV